MVLQYPRGRCRTCSRRGLHALTPCSKRVETKDVGPCRGWLRHRLGPTKVGGECLEGAMHAAITRRNSRHSSSDALSGASHIAHSMRGVCMHAEA